jgi:hypothetical protein
MKFTKVRDWSTFQNFRVEIATGGEAVITVTEANHIHFDANHHSMNGRPGDRCWIVCRGIDYGASLHFARLDGEWTVMDRPYVSRLSTSKDASDPAIKWIVAAAQAIIAEFVAQHPETIRRQAAAPLAAQLPRLRSAASASKRGYAGTIRSLPTPPSRPRWLPIRLITSRVCDSVDKYTFPL